MHEKKHTQAPRKKIFGNETHADHLDSYPGKGLGDGDAAPAALVSASPPRAGRETPEVTGMGDTWSLAAAVEVGAAAAAEVRVASPPRAGRETPEVTEMGGTRSSGVGGATTWYLPQQKQNKGPKQM